MTGRYLAGERAQKVAKSLMERVFATPGSEKRRTTEVTLAAFMPPQLRGEPAAEVREDPVSVGLVLERYAPRARMRMPDHAAACEAAEKLLLLAPMKRLWSAVKARARARHEAAGAEVFRMQAKTALAVRITGPLGIGGFCVDWTSGLPCVPAAVVKGALRHYLTGEGRGEEAERFCGAPGRRGSLVFFDALPAREEDMRITCEIACSHEGRYRRGKAPDDWHEPKAVLFGVIPAGVQLDFAVAGEGGRAVVVEALEKRGVGARRVLGWGRLVAV